MTAPDRTPNPTDPAPVGAPVETCQDRPRDEVITEILLDVTDEQLLLDSSTPQGQARLWLIDEDDSTDPCTYPTFIQRYAMATMYFSMAGSNWDSSVIWLTAEKECDWTNVECNDFDAVSKILLGEFSFSPPQDQPSSSSHEWP